jgi:hypothetical protein
MIYKYASIYEILEKLFRDTGMADDINWEDCVVWAGEALDAIGAYQQYIRKVTGDLENPCLDIVDFKAKLPCDFHKLEQIAVNGYAARYAGNTFHHILDGCMCTTQNSTAEDVSLFTDNWGNTFSNLSGGNLKGLRQPYTFDINDNYITLNVQEGKVCIAYQAVPLDKNGFPMIPDKDSYKNAVTKYIIMKLDYQAWRTGKIADKVFQHSEREWLWYCGQAKGDGNTPNIDKMEQIKKQFIKLIPNIDQHRVFGK